MYIPHSDKAGAGRDFIPEGISNLGSSERQFALVKLQQAFEVEEYSLCSFWPQIAERRWGRGKIRRAKGWGEQ